MIHYFRDCLHRADHCAEGRQNSGQSRAGDSNHICNDGASDIDAKHKLCRVMYVRQPSSTNRDWNQDVCDREVFSVQRGASSVSHSCSISSLVCSLASDPSLDMFVKLKDAWCAVPLLFGMLLLFLVGFSDSFFGIEIVATGPVIERQYRGHNWIGRPRAWQGITD